MSNNKCPNCERNLSLHSTEEQIDCIVGIVHRLDENFKKLPHYGDPEEGCGETFRVVKQ